MNKNILSLAITTLLLSTAVSAEQATTMRKNFEVSAVIPAPCMKSDIKSKLATDTSATATAAASVLDTALSNAVVLFKANGYIEIVRHGNNGAVNNVSWGATLDQSSLSLASTADATLSFAFAEAAAISNSFKLKTQNYQTVNIASATSTATASAGAVGGGTMTTNTQTSSGSGNLGSAANLSATYGSNITRSETSLGFAVDTFAFANSASDTGVSLDETAGVLTSAISLACTGLAGTSCQTGTDTDSDDHAAAVDAAAKATAEALSETHIEGVMSGLYQANIKKASVYDTLEAGGIATINLECGGDVNLTVEATVSSN